MSRMKKLETIDDSELSPCPKCEANPDVMVWYIKGSVNRKNYAVVCPKCGYRLKGRISSILPKKRWLAGIRRLNVKRYF
ncbi:hypothetical protein IJJ18_01255 [Candidatus Saccharibacteria bacterium]|nr:hypothetical protein [Candidatus Saccharibacteria bacterium]